MHYLSTLRLIFLGFTLMACVENKRTDSQTISGNLSFDLKTCFEQDVNHQCANALDQSHVCIVIQLTDLDQKYMLYGQWQNQALLLSDIDSVTLTVGTAFQSAIYFFEGTKEDCQINSESDISRSMLAFEECHEAQSSWCLLKSFQNESIYRENQTNIQFNSALNRCSISSQLSSCQMINCQNGFQDPLEGGIDCGGICEPCQSYCLKNEDCPSLNCQLTALQGICIPASCDDGIQNLQEEGIDCGGDHCPKCPAGFVCESDSQCEIQCINGKCCADDDHDLICNEIDLCPLVEDQMGVFANLSQKEYFSNLGYLLGDESIGANCSDFDQDLIVDILDNCPIDANPQQENQWMGLDLGDACEDQDGDGSVDAIDLCVNIANRTQSDIDQDLIGDACDPDIDNDGKINEQDSAPNDIFICIDEDADLCDECSSGYLDSVLNDGLDVDQDGICDASDPDIDDDGRLNTEDSHIKNTYLCADTDSDLCDDCSSGHFNINLDGDDLDQDGICNVGDSDIDNDGKSNDIDRDIRNASICSDDDMDGCDDCSRGSFHLNNDGDDIDMDGICNATDLDSDNDGVYDLDEQLKDTACEPQMANQCLSNICMNCFGFDDGGREFYLICLCD